MNPVEPSQLLRAMLAARSTKVTGNVALAGGLIALVVAVIAGMNGAAIVFGFILLVAGIGLRISANMSLNNTILRLAYEAIDRPAPKGTDVPVAVQQEIAMFYRMSVEQYAAQGRVVPLDEVFARLIREGSSLWH